MIWGILIFTWVLAGLLCVVIFAIEQKNKSKNEKYAPEDFYGICIVSFLLGYLTLTVRLVSNVLILLYNWTNTTKPKIETPTIYQENHYRDSARKQ